MPRERVQAPRVEAVLLVSERSSARRELLELAALLAGTGIKVEHTRPEELAARLATLEGTCQCALLDAGDAACQDEPKAVEAAASLVRSLRGGQATVAPVVVTTGQTPSRLVAAAFRAGAADVLELESADDLVVLTTLDRAAAEHHDHQARRTRWRELRQVVDEFLRVLVKAERRTMELEDSIRPVENEPEPEGPPCVLVVDDEAAIATLLEDVLTRAGLRTRAVYSGEEAVDTLARALDRRDPIDMVLMDKNLPGIDGIEAIRQLRARLPGLPCIVMTGFSTKDSAVQAADLGVVGYVLKPFDDVRQLARRVSELAGRFAAERRERRFLARIKQRHAVFLERYQRIAAELDTLADS